MYRNSDFNRETEPRVRDVLGSEDYRHPVRRDYARLIHSPSFRRLQGKTQLFPGSESDFFRNRLTHSLEVSQIAESIAHRLNSITPNLQKNKNLQILPDICRVAGLFHDLGHPPFGHNGEKALDECMKSYGGFEGNAQTLRIITKLEKKATTEDVLTYGISPAGKDNRKGLALTYRVIASALKYDEKIPLVRKTKSSVKKGYYNCDSEIVETVKKQVAPGHSGKFKTIECGIMDLSDDIAYSTYDLEDALKANFITPITTVSINPRTYKKIADSINKNTSLSLSPRDVLDTIYEVFSQAFPDPKTVKKDTKDTILIASYSSQLVAQNGYIRSDFTSDLISDFISGVTFELNEEFPCLSRVYFNENTLRKVEVLKRYMYETMILSPRLKTSEYRGGQIVKFIFKSLDEENGRDLLPDDFRTIYDNLEDLSDRKRVICDFIAGMTDSYAIEFYARLNSENPQTIFKPF